MCIYIYICIHIQILVCLGSYQDVVFSGFQQWHHPTLLLWSVLSLFMVSVVAGNICYGFHPWFSTFCKGGLQWKQGVVIYMTLYTSLLYNATPIHCTPLRLHPPLQSIQVCLWFPPSQVKPDFENISNETPLFAGFRPCCLYAFRRRGRRLLMAPVLGLSMVSVLPQHHPCLIDGSCGKKRLDVSRTN